MMSKEQFEQLISKLDVLIKVTAANAFKGKSKEESILALSELGFGNTEIAVILGTTANYVGKVKSEAKKSAGQEKSKSEDKGGTESPESEQKTEVDRIE
jgi:hypothetical protein